MAAGVPSIPTDEEQATGKERVRREQYARSLRVRGLDAYACVA
jgi:hypothetical protein